MKNKWKISADKMTALKEHFLSVRKTKPVSVHKTLVYRALSLLLPISSFQTCADLTAPATTKREKAATTTVRQIPLV